MSAVLPRVGIISDARFPSNHTDTQQIMKNASALARTGLPVELIVPLDSTRLLWSRRRRMRDLLDFYNVPNGLEVSQLMTLPGGDLRPHTKLAHGIVAPLFLLTRHCDVVYSRNLIPSLVCFGLGKRLVFETYRSWGDELPRLVGALGRYARRPRFLGMISHSNYAAQSMIAAGFPADKIVVMHNGYDLEDMQPVLSRSEARKELRLPPKKRLVVYTGNMQANKGMESVLDVAARLPEVDFLLVGGLPRHITRLKAYQGKLGASNVVFTGHKPVAELRRYLYAADVLIIPPTRKPLDQYGRTVLPMKLFTYLAAGRPILAPALPDSRELLDHDGNACLVTPDDPDGTAEALRELLADPKRCRSLAAGAARIARELTWDARAGKIKDWLLTRLAGMEGA